MSLMIFGISVIVFLALSAAAFSPKILPSFMKSVSTNARKFSSMITPRNHPKAVAARAIEIRDNALQRLAKYELDVTLAANCTEMSNIDHAPTADLTRALRKFSQAEENIVGKLTKKTSKDLLMLAMDFAHKVSKAEIPMLSRAMNSGYLTNDQELDILDELNKIKDQELGFSKLGFDVTKLMEYTPLTPHEQQKILKKKALEEILITHESKISHTNKITLNAGVSKAFVLANPSKIDWRRSDTRNIVWMLNSIAKDIQHKDGESSVDMVFSLYSILTELAAIDKRETGAPFLFPTVKKAVELSSVQNMDLLVESTLEVIKLYRGITPIKIDKYLNSRVH